ncbi:MAG: nucleotidyltransferase family protein, partial [Methanophagales archaeon]|nr:nucleotidyltransferase family protein [Methanophagales archaeon]
MDLLDLSSGDRLLLYCTRTSMDEAITQKVKGILNDRLDWDYIVETSMRHGISPLLYWNLSRIDDGEYVPAEVMTKLRIVYYKNIAWNMLRYDELSKILIAFNDAEIDVIVLKGAFLAETIYKNIGLRPMSDIDILVRREDLQKVKKELVQLGYAGIIYPTKWHEKLYTQWQTELKEEIQFNKHDKNVRIDVHWNVQPPVIPFQIDINKFWENAQPVKIAGVETLMLAPEDLLQHLCLHLDKHINSGAIPFRWYCDIAEVIRHYEGKINWKYLVQNSKNYGIEEPIYQSLYFVNKYLGAFVPKDVLETIKTVNVNSNTDFEDIFKSSMTIEGKIKKRNQWREINYLKRLNKIDGIWNKAHILFGDVFPCKEFVMQRYQIQNKKLIGFYYV